MSEREQFMRRAIAISGERMRAGLGGPFGAVVVMDGKIVAEGFNQVTSSSDPTAHAEVVAIRAACSALGRFNLEGCELYSSCEPCPMCLGAIYWARLDRVYFANDRNDAARIGFDDDHIYREFAKAMHERHLEFIHMPMKEARAVFQEWVDKPDKVRY
ncbi:MAG TPA: nucleoside deaminase [Dongiaceae bacterium]|jgi:tRNA(Arg) A34 adenosine deaminase TadA